MEGLDPEKHGGALISVMDPKDADKPFPPKFDAAKTGADGSFATDRLLPGDYLVKVEVYEKLLPNRLHGHDHPVLVGTAEVKVPAEGVAEPITIRPKPVVFPKR